jgi:hypothetical protein
LVASRATGAANRLSSGANVVCDTIVKGSVNVSASSSSVRWDIGLCGGNTIGRSVVFDVSPATTNTISGNGVGGNLVCFGNGAVATSENTVGGRSLGQCG